MPDEVNIDDLIDLPNDQERVQKLKVPKKVTVNISGNFPDSCNVHEILYILTVF